MKQLEERTSGCTKEEWEKVMKFNKTLKKAYWGVVSAAVGLAAYSVFHPEQVEAVKDYISNLF